MKSNSYLQYKFDKRFILYFILFVGAFLRILYFHQFDDYYDDWNFFFTVDPNVSNEITWVRYFGNRRILPQYNISDWGKVGEDFPYYFAFLTKFVLSFIGYSVEKAHIFLLIFSIGSFFIIIKICDLIVKDINFKILVLILIATNIFLIREPNSLRPHALSIFFTLLSLYYFILIYLKNKTSYKNIILFSIITLFFMSIWPLNLAFFGGQCCFLIKIYFNKKVKNLKILIIPALTIILLYLILNYNYLEYQVLNKSQHYTTFQTRFFYTYFFNTFFGSIVFGGFMLLVFSYFYIKEILKTLRISKYKLNLFMKNLENESIFLIIILTIYILITSYSLLKAPVMAPKYISFLVPIIIIWVSYKIYQTKKKLTYYFVICFSLLNVALYWDDIQIDRPPTKKILKIISESKNKEVYTTEDWAFNHYLAHHNISLKKNINFNKFDEYQFNSFPNEFWFLCLNNPRYAIGDNDNPDNKRCFAFQENTNFYLIKTIKLPDYLIHYIAKK
jgi:xanthosine utilization system XapX-like protein